MAVDAPETRPRKPLLRRRRLALLGAGLLLLVVALAVNTVWVDSISRPAEPRDGGKIIETSIEPANVKVEGQGPPIVLIHGYGGALDWWDDIAPELARHYRVIRLDLIGHGGTAAPTSGYEITRQADLVAAVLDKLGVDRVAVVGHSMGGWVATALATKNPQRITRLIFLDTPPTTDLRLSLASRAHVAPVLGEVVSHFVTDGLLRDGLADAFAPNFSVPERFVADLKRIPHCAFRQEHVAGYTYCEKPIDERLAELKPTPPLLFLYGLLDTKMTVEQADRYKRVPGARLVKMDRVGHTPQIEASAWTVQEIESFLK